MSKPSAVAPLLAPDLLDAYERELEAERAINQRIFDTSLDLILVVDPKGTFIRVSPSSEAIIGYFPEEIIGRSAAEFLHPDDLESTRNELRLARRGLSTRNFESRYMHKDGHAVTLAWTGVWSEPEQQHFFIGRDMTERMMLERQLRQAQKMEAIGQLTGGVAHDFNNILTVITGTIEILAKAVAHDSELAAIAKSIDEEAERGTQLTRRMLESLGYRVQQAEDAKTALAILLEGGEIDLLFTDLIMPNGMGGQDLLRKAREQRPGLKGLFASGYSENFIKGPGDADQDAPLLNKPYRKQKLAAAIRGVLDGGGVNAQAAMAIRSLSAR